MDVGCCKQAERMRRTFALVTGKPLPVYQLPSENRKRKTGVVRARKIRRLAEKHGFLKACYMLGPVNFSAIRRFEQNNPEFVQANSVQPK